MHLRTEVRSKTPMGKQFHKGLCLGLLIFQGACRVRRCVRGVACQRAVWSPRRRYRQCVTQKRVLCMERVAVCWGVPASLMPVAEG